MTAASRVGTATGASGGGTPTATGATPVYWDAELGAFRVVGFAEASAVLRGDGWSSDPRRSPIATDATRQLPPNSLLFMDPPEHTRLRHLLSPAFTVRAVGGLRSRVTAIVDAVLDGLPALEPEVDVLYDVAYPVPLAVIAELLDVGAEGASLFAEHTADLVRILEFDAGPAEQLAAATASAEIMLFLTPLLAERARTPGDDFISALLHTGDGGADGAGLSLDEVLATCVLLLAAGHETTANLVTTATYELLRHPDQVPHLLADPVRAVEELVRLTGPVKLVTRTAVVDQELGGTRIGAGQAVLIDVRRAHRDPNRFTDPQRLDLTREPSGHLGFGGGLHFCLGAALARLEAQVLLPGLFTRYPNLALTGEPVRWRDSTAFHALAELPVRLGAARPPFSPR